MKSSARSSSLVNLNPPYRLRYKEVPSLLLGQDVACFEFSQLKGAHCCLRLRGFGFSAGFGGAPNPAYEVYIFVARRCFKDVHRKRQGSKGVLGLTCKYPADWVAVKELKLSHRNVGIY